MTTNQFFSKEDQVKLLLELRWSATILKSHPEIEFEEQTAKFLTINKQDMIDILSKRPELAQAYFKKEGYDQCPDRDDVFVMWKEGDEYVVALMNRGTPMNPTRHRALAEAIAELFYWHTGAFGKM